MAFPEEDRLALARRLIDETRRIVERQRAIIHRRQLAGLDTELSEDVLRTFEQSLVMFEDDLALLSPKRFQSSHPGNTLPVASAASLDDMPR
jgi:hypothetical protein